MTSSYLGVLPQLRGGVVAAPADVAHPRVLPGLVRAVRVRVQRVLKRMSAHYRVVHKVLRYILVDFKMRAWFNYKEATGYTVTRLLF